MITPSDVGEYALQFGGSQVFMKNIIFVFR